MMSDAQDLTLHEAVGKEGVPFEEFQHAVSLVRACVDSLSLSLSLSLCLHYFITSLDFSSCRVRLACVDNA